jgi:hypothetical protein
MAGKSIIYTNATKKVLIMKTVKMIIAVSLLLSSFFFVRCNEATNPETNQLIQLKLDTVSFAHSMKGWELYSWPNGKDFNYSVLMGTNRAKTYEEVLANKLRVSGKDSLNLLLNKFPESESIFWIVKSWGNKRSFVLPDQKTVDEIKAYCVQKKLTLMVIE